ncbi:MAG: hypothetical protein M1833_001285 [Piccolia ochrophora]|nr:MAG: hypothetical protein M1833_001285 [Piccolia ochrophora]
MLADCGISKLEAEPQEGPTEYKLHLLLRPRRQFVSSSTGSFVAGSQRNRPDPPTAQSRTRMAGLHSQGSTPPPAASTQTRQARLLQLTTQLLWRLQQSSPYHSSSTTDLILPKLPEATPKLGLPTTPSQLLPGLEDSRGALYEIGVSDDGTFVGLTKDEMEESLDNLRAMAASLGCCVDVLRMVTVGECEWTEDSDAVFIENHKLHADKLWVGEAFVRPCMNARHHHVRGPEPTRVPTSPVTETVNTSQVQSDDAIDAHSVTEQLRVSLTGATMSGKSSLLGTLSTATLDNGRGKSRLSLLRHRHELASGVTSSVTQELVGYRSSSKADDSVTEVVNFASGNVSSWTDIHASTESERLVFFADSAGHPRYWRTTVRGLLGWAPHWTLLCVAADSHDSTGKAKEHFPLGTTMPTSMGTYIEPSQAHMELCLDLGLSLVVVFTKMDLASRAGLKRSLGKVLSTLKSAGRIPVLLPAGAFGVDTCTDADLRYISRSHEESAEGPAALIREHGPDVVVPIVLTSALNGSGVGVLHSMLRALPVPTPPAESTTALENGAGNYHSGPLFHIEEIFSLPAMLSGDERKTDQGCIISGHLSRGTIQIGDELVLGPFPVDSTAERTNEARLRNGDLTLGLTEKNGSTTEGEQSGHHPHIEPSSPSFREIVYDHNQGDWREVRVVSLRNLRLPVKRLLQGQVGTVGLVDSFQGRSSAEHDTGSMRQAKLNRFPSTLSTSRIRKGMVLLSPTVDRSGRSVPPQSCAGFTGSFRKRQVTTLSTGSEMVVYIASIRAAAKIVQIEDNPCQTPSSEAHRDDIADLANEATTKVTFRFTSREWVETGTKALVMPRGRLSFRGGTVQGEQAVGGLEGFVGTITGTIP